MRLSDRQYQALEVIEVGMRRRRPARSSVRTTPITEAAEAPVLTVHYRVRRWLIDRGLVADRLDRELGDGLVLTADGRVALERERLRRRWRGGDR